jgi:hypothetical protein
MIPVHKLIRQIRAGLAGGTVEMPAEALAAEYVRLAQEAEQRLEACAAMIEKGSEYQALQLAETEPGLLDLLAALSFAEAPEWAAHCAEEGLPVAPKFDSKAVAALDALYAKGISANHPLYKDYRAAVSSRDDERAIRIIRSIVRLNGGDANARSELARLENKLFQVQLHALREALAARDEAATIAALDELERLAPAAKLAELPEFQQAAEVRRLAARREAITQAGELARTLPEARGQGAWRKAGELLAQINALETEHDFELEPATAAQVTEIRAWSEGERNAAAETQRFQSALGNVGMQAEQIETRLLTRATLTLPEAEEALLTFNRSWKDVEKFQRAVPEEIVRRVRASASALRTELDRMQRQRRLRIGSVAAAVCVTLALAAWFAVRAYRAQDYAGQLARLQESGQVEAAEKMIAHLRTEEPGLAGRPLLRAKLDATEDWTHGERGKLSEAETHLAGLEKAAAGGFADLDPVALNTEMESTTGLIEHLAEGVRGGPADRLAVVRNGFEAYLTSIREKLATAAGDELARLEELAGSGLGYDRDQEALTVALAQVEPGIKALEARARSSVQALELPAALQARVDALRQRAEIFRKELDLIHHVRETLLQATTLDGYEQALAGFKDSRLAQAAEIKDARKLLAVFPKADEVLAALILPGDPAGWAAAKKELSADPFVPDAVLPVEITKLLAIREDSYLNDIWQMTLTNPGGRGGKREVFSRGELKKSGPRDIGDGVQNTSWAGAIYDPGVKAEIAAFTPTTIQVNRNSAGSIGSEIADARLTDGSQCLARLELNRMTDAEGTKFERPLLKAFDDLVREKQASPLYRGYLMQQLGALIDLRPYAWGLQYSCALRADLARLKELTGNAPLRSMDWLLERKRNELGGKLASFFNELGSRNYLADARRHRDVARAALNAGLHFGGFLDGERQAHLLGEASAARALWAVPEGGGVGRFDPKAAAKFAHFSPVFFVPLQNELTVADRSAKGAARPPAIPLLE